MKILPSPIGAGTRHFDDGLDDGVDLIVGDEQLQLALGEEVHAVLAAAIELGVALLAAEALDFGHGEALDPDLHERRLDVVEFEGLDECFDFLHAPPVGVV